MIFDEVDYDFTTFACDFPFVDLSFVNMKNCKDRRLECEEVTPLQVCKICQQMGIRGLRKPLRNND